MYFQQMGRNEERRECICGLETEILDYSTSTWVQVDDYPFSDNDRYVLFSK